MIFLILFIVLVVLFMDTVLKILILCSHADGKAKFHEMSIQLEELGGRLSTSSIFL